MSISAATLVATQSARLQQSAATAMVKQQADAEASVVGLLEQALDAARQDAPPPPGQGLQVDLQA